MALRVSHADHAAPIVQHQRQVVPDTEMIEQCLQVLDAAGQGVVVVGIVGFVGQAAADVIGNDDAPAAAQAENQRAVEKGPGRVAVEHDHWLALALVEIVQPSTRDVQEVAGERIQPLRNGERDGSVPPAHHSTPSMRQFRPLPMPSRPTRSPGRRKSRSSASAAVNGSDTVPMLPRYS